MQTPQELFDSYIANVKNLSTQLDFYEFEKQFVNLHDAFGRQMLEHRLTEEVKQPVYKKKLKPATAPSK